MCDGVFHRVFHRLGSFPHDDSHIVIWVTGVIHRVFHKQGGMGRPSGCSRPDGGGVWTPLGYWSYPQGFPQAGRDGQTFGVFAAGWGRGVDPHHINCVVCVSFRCVPCLVLWCASRFKGSLMGLGPPFCSSRNVAMVFLNAIIGDCLRFFACFCNILLFFALFCMFMHCALCVAFVACVAPCMVHGIGMHVMHHIIIDVFIIMFIIDHH
nr:MAG TPA: hypothetical protein [Caudoviricetes sp.]